MPHFVHDLHPRCPAYISVPSALYTTNSLQFISSSIMSDNSATRQREEIYFKILVSRTLEDQIYGGNLATLVIAIYRKLWDTSAPNLIYRILIMKNCIDQDRFTEHKKRLCYKIIFAIDVITIFKFLLSRNEWNFKFNVINYTKNI